MVPECLLVIPTVFVLSVTSLAHAQDGSADRLSPVPFTRVQINDEFWRPRLEVNRNTTVGYCFDKCEETGRIDNFAKAAGLLDGPHIGARFDDSDVFKVIEGAAYSLAVQRDPALEAYLDDLIEKIAAAQEQDGYLFTARTINPEKPADASGQTRWAFTAHSHELYNVGHMYEAATAYYQATGKRSLLEVAIRNADLIDHVFGPGKRHDPPGHEEIEIGLVKLYRVTGDRRYLDLARFFIDRRGHKEGRAELYGAYAQDHIPVVEQDKPVGHAVRAMYLYCGMADVAAETKDEAYLAALDRIWNNMVQTKLYLTGGVGARRAGEAFGEDYELPNETAYNETCAAIGNAMWNHRMGLLHRDARYIDVLERIMYNGFLSGVSLSGDRFFYPNPLASGGTYHRSPWFSCSCCPVNVVRFVPSIAGYVFAHDDNGVFVNLYMACSAQVELDGNTVNLRQQTQYPWDGRISITVDPEREERFDVRLRVPGWARGAPVPSDLYQYVDPRAGHVDARLMINGEAIPMPPLERGYAQIDRLWKRGDVVTIEFEMPVRRVRSHGSVEANRGRLAIERGPIVYCLEATDNKGHIGNIWIPEDSRCAAVYDADLLGGVTVIRGNAFELRDKGPEGQAESAPTEFTAIPYYAWNHREPGEMAVWIPSGPELAEAIAGPTLASESQVRASHCWTGDSVRAVNDLRDPASSGDHSIPRFTWWDHKGGHEWIQYEFAEPKRISSVDVYWFDDTGVGGCRVPAAWRILIRKDGKWAPVSPSSTPGTDMDVFNHVRFDPVTTSAVRLEVELRDGFSGGILEWRVN